MTHRLNGRNIGKVGKLIKERRIELGLSREELAKKVGYAWPNMITMIENGKTAFPMRQWQRFAEVLAIPKRTFLRVVIKEAYPDMMRFLIFASHEEELDDREVDLVSHCKQ